jgi:hypothetical protein
MRLSPPQRVESSQRKWRLAPPRRHTRPPMVRGLSLAESALLASDDANHPPLVFVVVQFFGNPVWSRVVGIQGQPPTDLPTLTPP